MTPLVPCPSCARHVRSNEASCPFCEGALPAGLGARAIPAARVRLDRLAAFTFAASLALAACGGKAVEPIPSEDGNDRKTDSAKRTDDDERTPAPAQPADDDDYTYGSMSSSYGGPPPPPKPKPNPSDEDAGTSAAMYGMPPGG